MFIINKNAIGLVKIDKIVKRLIVKNNNKIKISIKIKRQIVKIKDKDIIKYQILLIYNKLL